MTGPSPIGRVALVVCSFVGVVACAPSAEVRGCATADECPAGSRCISSRCVANAPPSVAVAVPTTPEANVLLSFDASASTDPDPGDAVVSFSWTFRALSGEECAPPVVAGTGPVANVRFGCPGRYAVDVTATDGMGGSSTATKELDVTAHDGPALLTVGADVAVDHSCTPTPWCSTASPVTLSATTPGIAPDQVSFTWTVVPPVDRPLSPSRRASFSPSADVQAPGVTIETDGDAISGDWIFRVEARDAAGVIGTGVTRVSILNRPPELVKTLSAPNHAFGGSQFTASGEVPFTVSDPDGDRLLDPVVEWRHSGDGTSTFTGLVLGTPARVTFSIAVPYAARADAAHLIGGAGLDRTIVFEVSDVNDGRTIENWPIVVANRPPTLMGAPSPFTIDHSYDPIGLAYVADVPLSTWSDPDGDPLFPEEGTGTGDLDCPELVLPTGSGVARAPCRLAFLGTPGLANFARTHTVAQTIQDPWEPAPTTSAVTFTIGNGAPVITSSAPYGVSSVCDPVTCCNFVTGEGCFEWEGDLPSSRTNVPSRWSDPDGDPLEVHIGAGKAICVDATCTVPLDLSARSSVCGFITQNLSITVSDGAATTSGTFPLRRGCLP